VVGDLVLGGRLAAADGENSQRINSLSNVVMKTGSLE
jgi:hypothetical protein